MAGRGCVLVWVVLSSLWIAVTVQKQVITIGGIFPLDSQEEEAFKLAIDMVNDNPKLLPHYHLASLSNHTGIVATFHQIQAVCAQMGQGVAAIVGPMASTAVKASYPMCQGLQVPMVAPSATDPMLANHDRYAYLLRMMPSDSMQSMALVDLVKHFRWDTVAILTDNSDYGINGLVEFQAKAAENKWRVLSVQQFIVTSNISQVDAFAQLKNIKGTGARIVILHCFSVQGHAVLETAHELGMTGAGWVWIVTDGITAFKPDLLHNSLPDKPYLRGLLGTRPVTAAGELYPGAARLTPLYNKSQASYSLAFYDSVLVLAHALHRMLEVDGHRLETPPLSCKQIPAKPWRQGALLYRYLKQVSTAGVMHHLDFDNYGAPTNASYDIVRLGDSGWDVHGRWSDWTGLELNTSGLLALGDQPVFDVRDYVGDLVNKTLRVVTLVDQPFVFKKDVNSSCSGNACFYGYSIDLLNQLASELDFQYELYEVADGKYGRRDDVTKKWNGMVADLIADDKGHTKADLAAASFTVSFQRQQVISFTKPYRDLQLGILLGSAADAKYDPWSFLVPLSYDLWGLTVASAFLVALVITLVDKLSPYGHHGKKAQIHNDHEHDAMDMNDDGTVDYWEHKEWVEDKHTMSFTNALLWALASLYEQGGERHPKSWSARMAAGAWWIGTLILVQSYTANLAAFLTIKATNDDITSVFDLASQKVIKYGTVQGSQIQVFFDTSQRSPYKEMSDQMRKWGTYFNSSEEASTYTVDMNGTFAMLYDMPGIEYWIGQKCSLRAVKNGFANIGYGFGLPKDSIYAEELTIKIYQLREKGYMDKLDDKWIMKTALCTKSTEGDIDRETVEVGMPALMGVFWIIYVGFGISFLILMGEWIWSIKTTRDPNDPNVFGTYLDALKHRFQVLKNDILENWFPINFHHKEIKRRESVIRPTAHGIVDALWLKRLQVKRSSRIIEPTARREDEGTDEVDDEQMLQVDEEKARRRQAEYMREEDVTAAAGDYLHQRTNGHATNHANI